MANICLSVPVVQKAVHWRDTLSLPLDNLCFEMNWTELEWKVALGY